MPDSLSVSPSIHQFQYGSGSPLKPGLPNGPAMSEQPTWNEPATGYPWWDRDRLVELLVNRGLTYDQAGHELGCHPKTVAKWARRYGVVREASA